MRRPHVYMLTQPASHYYATMTKHEPMPILIDQENLRAGVSWCPVPNPRHDRGADIPVCQCLQNLGEDECLPRFEPATLAQMVAKT